jgi:DNA-binding PadR family transcriptional regulator
MARKSSTTIRITEQSRQELKDLAAKMRISQAAVLELLIRDKYQQEISRKTVSLSESTK